MWFLTAETSVVRTQYLVVDRTKPCACRMQMQVNNKTYLAKRHSTAALTTRSHTVASCACVRFKAYLGRVLVLDAARVAAQLGVHIGQAHQDVAAGALHRQRAWCFGVTEIGHNGHKSGHQTSICNLSHTASFSLTPRQGPHRKEVTTNLERKWSPPGPTPADAGAQHRTAGTAHAAASCRASLGSCGSPAERRQRMSMPHPKHVSRKAQ